MAAPVTNVEINIGQIIIGVIGLLVSLVSFFGMRTLKGVDRNQNLLFDKHEHLEEKHSALRSEFDELKGEHKCRRKTDCAH